MQLLLPSRGSIGSEQNMVVISSRASILWRNNWTYRFACLRNPCRQIVERDGAAHDDLLGLERHSEVLDASTYIDHHRTRKRQTTYTSQIKSNGSGGRHIPSRFALSSTFVTAPEQPPQVIWTLYLYVCSDYVVHRASWSAFLATHVST